MQDEAAAGHAADSAGVRAAAAGRAGGDAVGRAGPHGAPPPQPHPRDQRHRPRRALPAAGLQPPPGPPLHNIQSIYKKGKNFCIFECIRSTQKQYSFFLRQ